MEFRQQFLAKQTVQDEKKQKDLQRKVEDAMRRVKAAAASPARKDLEAWESKLKMAKAAAEKGKAASEATEKTIQDEIDVMRKEMEAKAP